jgi:hypothetical protein
MISRLDMTRLPNISNRCIHIPQQKIWNLKTGLPPITYPNDFLSLSLGLPCTMRLQLTLVKGFVVARPEAQPAQGAWDLLTKQDLAR